MLARSGKLTNNGSAVEGEGEREPLAHLIKVQNGWKSGAGGGWAGAEGSDTQKQQLQSFSCVFSVAQMQMEDSKWQRKLSSYT